MQWYERAQEALAAFRHHLAGLDERMNNIEGRLDVMEPQVEALQQIASGLVTAFSQFTEDVEALIKGLTEKENNGGTIQASELEPITTGLGNLKQSVEAADATIKGEEPPPAEEPKEEEEPKEPEEVKATQSVYIFKEEASGAVAGPNWSPAPVQTAEEPPKKLYYYNGDTPGAEPFTTAGADIPGWELYTGPTEAAAA